MRKLASKIILLCCFMLSQMIPLSSAYAEPTGCPADMSHYWKLDESSQPYADFYGSTSATCTNCPTATTGTVNGAQQFTLNNRVNVADDNTFDWGSAGSFSIELWMKADSGNTCSTNQVLVGRDDSASQLHWWIGCYPDAGVGKAAFYLVDTASNDGWVMGTKNLTDNAWHHIVAVRDAGSGEMRIYVDGVRENIATGVSFPGGFGSASAALNIGWLNLNPYYYFKGALDEVALYNRALSEEEIQQHYYDGVDGLRWGYCSCGKTVTIMPLGDSITAGWNHVTQDQIGYRRKLNLDLINSGYNVDFVGSLQDPAPATNPDFDVDHEGHGGYTSDQVSANVYSWLTSHPADVILLHIGTNDISGNNEDAQEVADILDQIDSFSEDIPVVLSRIISRTDGKALQTTQFNDDVVAMAGQRTDDKITIVDNEHALVYPDDLSSDIHPNATGYYKMANVFFNALTKFLPLCEQVAPAITSSPVTSAVLGLSYSYDVSATGNPSPTYSLAEAPAWLTINATTGIVSGSPDTMGEFDVIVEASNIAGSDTQEFIIQVAECPADMSHYWKLDESSQPYADFYGSTSATCTNCPTATTGTVNGAQQFTLNNRVNVADDNTFDWGSAGSFSIELWMKADAGNTCSTNQVLVGRDDSASQLHWWIGCYPDAGVGKAAFYLVDTASNDGWVMGTKNLTDNAWHHIVAVRDAGSGEMRIYVDGVRENIATGVSFPGGFGSASAALNIGWLNLNPYYYFKGALDEVALYNRALSEEEIQQHYYDGVIVRLLQGFLHRHRLCTRWKRHHLLHVPGQLWWYLYLYHHP